MESYTSVEMRQALAPIASLIAKSEKAQRRLAAATWQRAMLQRNVAALRIAHDLLGRPTADHPTAPPEALREALATLDALIRRLENTKAFAPGTSTHSLQRNRLQALRIARAAVEVEIARQMAGKAPGGGAL